MLKGRKPGDKEVSTRSGSDGVEPRIATPSLPLRVLTSLRWRKPLRPFLSLILLFLSLLPIANAQTQTGASRPRLTPAQWREDLQFAIDTFLQRDRSFSPEARQQFRDTIATLQSSVEKKTDEQIIVEIAKAVALSKNAHTRLYILRNKKVGPADGKLVGFISHTPQKRRTMG
jgi:hypothetical protein